MRKAGIKKFICTLGILFVLNVGSVFNQINQNYGTWGATINWNGVKGPYRFDNYFRTKENESWSVWGKGGVLHQLFGNGNTEQRRYRPYSDPDIDFYGVWFDSSGNGWIVGGAGVIMHTNDNGRSWQQQVSNTTEDLDAITCIDATYCWILGRDEVFLRTTDGGKSWQLLDVLENASADLIDFVNAKVGWVADSGEDVLYRTTDGGKTWIKLVDGKMSNGVYDDLFGGIKFVNKRVGWAAGMDKVGYTDDGGKTWRVTEIGEDRRQYFVGIVSRNERTALAVNEGDWNYCTEDAGKTWKKCFRRKDGDSN
jgi:photosystem II stability/assembly factor-like uncharacterized protein